MVDSIQTPRLGLLSAAFLLPACFFLAVGCVPALTMPAPPSTDLVVPESYGDAFAEAPPDARSLGELPWEELFDDPALVALVRIALENNQELDLAFQEVVLAQAETRAATGEYLPMVGVGGQLERERVGEFTSQGASDEATGLGSTLTMHRFGLTATWEVDVWKKLRHAARAAGLRYLGSLEGRHFVVTRLVAEIASSYYELLALDRRLEVLEENVRLQENALGIVRLEKAAARVTELAVQRFEAEVFKNKGRRFDLLQRIVETENRLNLLLGRFPQPIARVPARFEGPLPELLGAGVPADLLENRPDVRQAELELRAAELDVRAAKAAFYPSLGVDASLGFESVELDELLEHPESVFWSLGGGLFAPLFNRRALLARYVGANAEQWKALLEYERTVLGAHVEVANQLAALDNLRRSYELEAQQVEVLTRANEVSSVLFQSARADYFEVLQTRREALEAQMELIETRLLLRRAQVDLYRALGGGWR